jgi:hypothetical protein
MRVAAKTQAVSPAFRAESWAQAGAAIPGTATIAATVRIFNMSPPNHRVLPSLKHRKRAFGMGLIANARVNPRLFCANPDGGAAFFLARIRHNRPIACLLH